MLEKLKFVERAVDDKGIIRALTHIYIYDGRAQGGDGRIVIDSECEELREHNFSVDAVKFIRAVEACDGDPKIEQIGDGRIKVSKSRTIIRMPTLKAEDYPIEVKRSDNDIEVEVPDNFLDVFKAIRDFISLDASRPWSQGVWLDGEFAYATNNVSMVRSPFKWTSRKINLPRFAVDEIVALGRNPDKIILGATYITLDYGDFWLKSFLYTDEWPQDTIDKLFASMSISMIDVPSDLLPAIERISPFCANPKMPVIHFKANAVSTDDGAEYAEVEMDWDGAGAYRLEVIVRVLRVAEQWDPSTYPGPVFFKGGILEGMMIGVRDK
jgi:hypothetical protein